MATGKRRGAKPFGAVATPAKRTPSGKDVRRASVAGRAAQGMGSGGKPGGTKSSGGKGHAKGAPTASAKRTMRGSGGRCGGCGPR